ncbi:2-isopropylmalate synthase [Chlamydiota bacterium]
MRKIAFFDTTLRDGEQSPGASMNIREKLQVATQLVHLNVDVIEAGFPIASPGDFEAVKEISQNIQGPVIAGLARCLDKDIERVANALEKAQKARIHVFLATSKIHMQYKLKKAEEEIVALAIKGVKKAKQYVDEVEFSPEDASRTDPDFLCRVVQEVIDAGATMVNIPDTVGYALPAEFGSLIKMLFEQVGNINKAGISVHCHNDLGLAVANSLAAIKNGATQVECTINGIGERAGNASLEEIVMILKTRNDEFGDVSTQIKTEEIMKTSRLVSNLTGIVVQPNKAIVGENAFAHEAGIHQDGVLKKETTYEIMKPESIGVGASKLVLGKHSGRHAFKAHLESLGFHLSEEEINSVFTEFIALADKKKIIFDEDIIALVEDNMAIEHETYHLDYVHISSGSSTIPTATVRLKRKDELLEDAACGDGPIDACYKTIDRITGIKGGLLDYSIRSITGGKDALGEVTIKIQVAEKIVMGRGASTDIIEASAKAYLNGINKVLAIKEIKELRGL